MSKHHVFLSYSRANLEEAQQLREDLQRRGIVVWWDKMILPGQGWKHEIRKAIKECSAFIFCVSEEGVAKTRSGIYPELFYAIDIYREFKPGEIFIIPVRFSECQIPDVEIDSARTLADFHYVDLFPSDKREQGVKRLLDSLQEVSSIPQRSDLTESDTTLAESDTTTVIITFDRNFGEFKQKSQDLLQAIGEVIGGHTNILNYSIQPGSVRLILELSPAHAYTLLWAVSAGEFDEYGAIDARLQESDELAKERSFSRDVALFKSETERATSQEKMSETETRKHQTQTTMPGMIDGDKLRMMMRRVPSPVTVVTAAGPDEMRGMTVGSFTSVSLDPPLISFNVALDAQMHDLIVTVEHFAVHLLSEAQAGLSNNFAIPDRSGTEQFADIAYRLDAHGTPILKDTLAVFYCAHYAVHPAGDHSLLVGQVLDIAAGVEAMPLVYFDRSYRRLSDKVNSRD